jgi:ABC-type branched-subunit amino acid transport system substrate-binding protein
MDAMYWRKYNMKANEHTPPAWSRRLFARLALALGLILTLAACGRPRPTIKIALVAPFEGRFREVGYDAFPAMRLALRQQIQAGGLGDYEVTFVAYNDNADPAFAERVAHNVVLDDSVMAVIGNLRSETTRAAQPVYSQAHLALVAPGVPADQLPSGPYVFRMGPSTAALQERLTNSRCTTSAPIRLTSGQAYQGEVDTQTLQLLADFQSPAAAGLLGDMAQALCFTAAAPYPRDLLTATQTLSAFADISGGFTAGPGSISAYDATRLILRALQADIDAHGTPTREGVAEALRHIRYDGLLGQITFDTSNTWAAAPIWVYQYDSKGTAHLID